MHFHFWLTFNINWHIQCFVFGQRLTWIGTNNDHIWIPKVNFMLSDTDYDHEFLRSGEVILSTVRSISNFTYLEWLQLYLSGMAHNFTYLEWLNYLTLMLKMVLFDQQLQRKLSDWGTNAHRLQWFILNGGAIGPRGLLFKTPCMVYMCELCDDLAMMGAT